MSKLGDLMKQAKDMQAKMQEMQDALLKQIVSGEAGGGLVKVEMTGRHEVKSINIDDSVLKEPKEIIEDLIAAAVNDAAHKIERQSKEQISKLTAGIKLPDDMKLPGDKD